MRIRFSSSEDQVELEDFTADGTSYFDLVEQEYRRTLQRRQELETALENEKRLHRERIAQICDEFGVPTRSSLPSIRPTRREKRRIKQRVIAWSQRVFQR